ncbi:PTS sugar transporter subunit IIC [Fundicoccus culcitae]|uniref:Permease IIC component n=1 Tax=Fundicoccus culcitae TaxID=2969821 RepID=A0ABY5PAM8_9LACT|nr:PTS sugar transporter subunit IIC [Fundicoccus culcitae]UUX35503.1 PTS sugar transporter subunit IIC [Fundicoccus culcitae]
MQSFMEEKFTPLASKFAANKYLVAVRDGMILTLPLIMIGSVFMVIASLPFPGWEEWLGSTGISDILWKGTGSSFDLMGLVAAFGITYTFVKENKQDGVAAGIISVSAFVTATPFMSSEAGNGILTRYTGSGGILLAIVIGLSTGVIYSWFIDRDYQIKMPEGVPPAISRSFSALLPGLFVITGWLIIYGVLEKLGIGNIHDIVGIVLGGPLSLLSDNLIGTLIVTLIHGLFWFMGIHGGNTVHAVMRPLWMANSGENLAAFQAGEEVPHIVTQQFIEYFVHIGGGGATLGLVIIIAILARLKNTSAVTKTMAPVTLVPGIFNINEPVLFGIPIVLNFKMLIPFIIVPMINATITYLTMAIGIVPKTIGIDVGWTMPAIINGFLATDNSIRAAILQIILIVIDGAIYYVFYREIEKDYKALELTGAEA